MKRILFISIFLVSVIANISAQTIRVDPTGVNVNSQNPTTAFLTFGQIPKGYAPAEALWCGELISATLPAQGLTCRPETIYGSLPARYNLSQVSGNGGFTDIMSIPSAVARRAYLAAVRGASAGFFYVRRFVSANGQPDQYVNVTCRMTGGGARVPFALTEVEFKTATKEPILFLKSGEKFPDVSVEIRYNGTGRLKGRWEIIQPGEEIPSDTDLLTEASLPIEQRANQKRYTQVERFNHFLPPTGKFVLKLENPANIPLAAEGQYLLLLRIEAVDDKEGDSDLQLLGVGNGVVHSGAVAGFPMPTLKFFVGGKSPNDNWETNALNLSTNNLFSFSWKSLANAQAYRLEIIDEHDKKIHSAFVLMPLYRAPSWFQPKFAAKNLRWRVVALDENGKVLNQTLAQAIQNY